MTLIVGATGLVGGEICQQLAGRGTIRALVRRASNPERISHLTSIGAELATGDLTDPSSLRAACQDVTAIVSTASSTISRQPGDSIETVDHRGQLSLIEAAEAAGVKHFVLISFPPVDVEFPLQTAKRAVEHRLRQSRMTYTILQPTFFMEVWLSPALGFDAANGRAQIYGSGHSTISWISFRDVAALAVAALDNPRAINQTIKIGGPDALSPLEVVARASRLLGKRFDVQHVPEDALRAQHAAAADALQESFAGLMLYYASGDVIDMTDVRKMLSVQKLTSVDDYFQTALQSAAD